MANNKSGTSMGGKIENIHNVKRVKCNCSICYHSHYLKQSSKKAKKTLHCKYYDIINPDKTTCARYYPR